MGDIKLFQIGQNQQVQQLLTGAIRVQVGGLTECPEDGYNQ